MHRYVLVSTDISRKKLPLCRFEPAPRNFWGYVSNDYATQTLKYKRSFLIYVYGFVSEKSS